VETQSQPARERDSRRRQEVEVKEAEAVRARGARRGDKGVSRGSRHQEAVMD
jgi:hypothetical protein